MYTWYISDMQQVALSQKRVRIFFVGGIGELTGQSHEQVHQHFQRYLDLQLLAHFDFDVLHNVVGADSDWSHVDDLSYQIQQHYHDYDGFVVVHPVDSAAYISNLLAFASPDLGKPVVFTGPAAVAAPTGPKLFNKDLWHQQMVSLRTNLLSSMQLATSECSGVFLAYNLVAIEAVQAFPRFDKELMGFDSPTLGLLADLQFGVSWRRPSQPRFEAEVGPLSPYSRKIEVLTAVPGMDMDLTTRDVDGYIIYGFAHEPLPTTMKIPEDKPILVMSRGYQANPATTVLTAAHLPLPTALAKMMVGVGVTDSAEDFVKWYRLNKRGEPESGKKTSVRDKGGSL